MKFHFSKQHVKNVSVLGREEKVGRRQRYANRAVVYNGSTIKS